MKTVGILIFVVFLEFTCFSNGGQVCEWETRFHKSKYDDAPLFPYARIGGGWYVKGMVYDAMPVIEKYKIEEKDKKESVGLNAKGDYVKPTHITTVSNDNNVTPTHRPLTGKEDDEKERQSDLAFPSKETNVNVASTWELMNSSQVNDTHDGSNVNNKSLADNKDISGYATGLKRPIGFMGKMSKDFNLTESNNKKHDLLGEGEDIMSEGCSVKTQKAMAADISRHNNNTVMFTERRGDNRINLHIIGLFAMTGEYPAGMSYLPAALLAIRLINNNASMLPGYKLQLNAHDTRCSEEWALDAIYKELYTRNRRSIITLGSTCSHVTETTAKVSNIWGMVQISYSAVSPHLSNQTIFPSFFRVTTPEQNLTTARVHMIKAMNWSRVHILYQNFKLFSTLNEYMIKDLNDHNITVEGSYMFTSDPNTFVRSLMEKDARIIFGSFYEDMARKVMCAAYNLPNGHIWYKRVVWFLPSFLDRRWMEVSHRNCTSTAIKQVIGRYFTIGSIIHNNDPSYQHVGNFSYDLYQEYNLFKGIENEIPREFRHQYMSCNSRRNCFLYAMHRSSEAFDAVWAIAFALKNTLRYLQNKGDSRRLEDFDYGKKYTDLPCIIREAMQNVTFRAISGSFHFNSKGEGTSKIEIVRYNNSGNGTFTRVGNCTANQSDRWNCFIEEDIIYWDTKSGKPPYDGTQTRTREIEVELWVMITIYSLAFVGVMTSLCLLVFNVWNRNHRIIKMSSPRLNNLILIGSVLGYMDVVLDDHGVKPQLQICMIRLFIQPLGFCLVFGSLFAKTWRVYEIFTAGTHAHKLKKKILRDSWLLVIVAILVAINWAIAGAWAVISPQQVTTAEISATEEVKELCDLDVKYVNLFHHCESRLDTEFSIATSAVNGVMLIFGAFLAILTRKVSYPEFNDSRMIAMAIYNVVIVYPVTKVISFAIQDKPVLRYELKNILQITMSSVTLGLIFLPKIISYRRHNRHNQDIHVTCDLGNINTVLNTVVIETGKCQPSEKNVFRITPDFGQCKSNKKSPISIVYLSGGNQATEEKLSPCETFNENDSTTFGNGLQADENKSKTLACFEQNDVILENTERKRRFGSMHSWFSMMYPQFQLPFCKTENSPNECRSGLSCLRKSLSDTNLSSVMREEGKDDKEEDWKKDMDSDCRNTISEKKETHKKPPKTPKPDQRWSNTCHDDTFIQSIELKTGVKVVTRSRAFGRAMVGFKASWKQRGNVKRGSVSHCRKSWKQLNRRHSEEME